jgi:hypothetical protein
LRVESIGWRWLLESIGLMDCCLDELSFTVDPHARIYTVYHTPR